VTEAETLPTLQREPSGAESVEEERSQTTTSQDNDFEGLKIQGEQRDHAIDCKSTDHGGHSPLID
jgi:hypothetical protein